MSVYSELWALLRPVEAAARGALLGTLSAYSPPAVTVGETVLTQRLYWPSGTRLTEVDLGRAAALLPCGEDGWLIIFVEGSI